jgi:hypothetical protein
MFKKRLYSQKRILLNPKIHHLWKNQHHKTIFLPKTLQRLLSLKNRRNPSQEKNQETKRPTLSLLRDHKITMPFHIFKIRKNLSP